MYIDDETMDKIREASKDLKSFCIAYKGMKFTKKGNYFYALCPFHSERTPSFAIGKNKDPWKFECYGCHKWGDAITFVRELEGVGYYEAAKIIADFYKIPIPENRKREDYAHREKAPKPKSKPKPIEDKEEPAPKYVDPSIVARSMSVPYKSNPLFEYLCGLFDRDMVEAEWKRYKAASLSIEEDRYNVRFWLVDSENKVRGAKDFRYKKDGHKQKYIKHAYKSEDGYVQCCFGEHLIDFSTTRVNVVESEKSAIMASLYYGDELGVWIAVGSKNNLYLLLKESILMYLINCKVVLYPDSDGIEEWKKYLPELWGSGIDKAEVTDMMTFNEDAIAKYTPESKSDIGDIIDWAIREDLQSSLNVEPAERPVEKPAASSVMPEYELTLSHMKREHLRILSKIVVARGDTLVNLCFKLSSLPDFDVKRTNITDDQRKKEIRFKAMDFVNDCVRSGALIIISRDDYGHYTYDLAPDFRDYL